MPHAKGEHIAPTVLLWTDPQLAADLTGQPMSRVIEDKHRRIQFAALCLVSSMIGFAALYAQGLALDQDVLSHWRFFCL